MRTLALQGHRAPLCRVRINADGDLLFTGAREKKVCVWFLETGERLGTYGREDPKNNMRQMIDGGAGVSGFEMLRVLTFHTAGRHHGHRYLVRHASVDYRRRQSVRDPVGCGDRQATEHAQGGAVG